MGFGHMEAQQKQDQPGQPGRITVTYEALFDMVVREKGRDELQSLSTNFFSELVSYLIEKKAMLAVLGPEEREKTARQLQNINRLVKELYERREKKILSLALARSRAGVDIIDTSALLAEEKALFEGLVSQLDAFRDGVLNNMLIARMPNPPSAAATASAAMGGEHLPARPGGAETLAAAARVISSPSLSAISGTNIPTSIVGSGNENESQIAAAENKQTVTKLVRFLRPVPRFVGKELEVYGPFDQEDIANLPGEIAEVLIMKGRAEEIAQA